MPSGNEADDAERQEVLRIFRGACDGWRVDPSWPLRKRAKPNAIRVMRLMRLLAASIGAFMHLPDRAAQRADLARAAVVLEVVKELGDELGREFGGGARACRRWI